MTIKDKHHKHPPLARSNIGYYHNCEWAIYGTTCGQISSFYQLIDDKLKSKYRISYIDADHRVEELNSQMQIGKKKYINQKTIADMLVLDQSTMSRDLKKLVKKDWIKIAKAKDSRHSELELTESGYALLEKVAPIWEELHQKVEGAFGVNQIKAIDALLEIAKKNLENIKK